MRCIPMAWTLSIIVAIFGFGAQSAHAAPKPTLSVAYPAIAVASRPATISGTVHGNHRLTGARAQLQQRVGTHWRTRTVTSHVRAHRFRMTFTPARNVTALRLRVRLVRGITILATSRPRRLKVSQIPAGARVPVDVPAAASVISIPTPGSAGDVTVAGTASARAGDYLAVGIGRATPEGFLGQITRVHPARGRTVLSTKPTTLIDAIPQGEIDQRVTQSAPATSFTPRSTAKTRTLGCGASGEVSVGVDKPELTRTIAFKAKWKLVGGIQSASLSATIALSAGAHASVAGAASCSLSKTAIAQFRGTPVEFQVGPVPVVLTPNASVFLDAAAKADAKLSTGLSASISATAGVQYAKGAGTSPLGSFDKTFTFDPPSLDAGGRLTANLTPTLNVLLYGVAGPEIAFKAGLDLDADIAKTPWWTLTAPVDLTAELVIPALKLSSPKLHVYQNTFPLAGATTSPPTPAPSTAPAAPPAPPVQPLPGSAAPLARHISAYSSTPDLQCGLVTQEDTSDEFYGGSGGRDACGTFLAVDGVLYGPATIPAGAALGPVEPWTPLSQASSGAGTQADPFTLVTTVAAGLTNVELTETDTWIDGGSAADSRISIRGVAGDTRAVRVYRAADCYVGNSDIGFGSHQPAVPSVGCLRDNGDGTQTELRLAPQSPGSNLFEGQFTDVWAAVGSQGPLANTCTCTTNNDNGFAVEWAQNLTGATPVVVDSRYAFVNP